MRSALGKPSSQGADCLLGPVEVAEAKGVDDASAWSEQSDVSIGADVEFSSVDFERRGVESVPTDRRCGSWLTQLTRQRDVDNHGDLVGQLVPRKRGRQAQRCLGRTDTDLEKVVVGINPRTDKDPAAKTLDASVVSPNVELSIRDAVGTRSGVSKHERKFFDPHNHV